MTLPRLQRLSRYWRNFPPAHVTIRNALYGAPKRARKQQTQEDLNVVVMKVGGDSKPYAALPVHIQRDLSEAKRQNANR